MTDGPNGPLIDLMADIRLEIMQQNLYLREVVEKVRQEIPAPVVNVAAPEVRVEAPSGPAPTLDLSPLTHYLDRPFLAPERGAELEALAALKKSVDDLGVGMRAIAGSAGAASGSSFVQAQQPANSPYDVRDYFRDSEFLPDQLANNAMNTFTFSEEVQLVFVRLDGSDGYCSVNSTDPAEGFGIPLHDTENQAIPCATTTVKVWGPTGTIHVWGFRY